MIQMKSSVNKAIHNEFHFRYKSEWFFGFNGRCAMNRVRYITAMSLVFAFAACSDDGTTIKGNSCELPKVECSGTCIDLGAMHLRDCGVCAEGYEDADGDATNGCEAKVDGENPGGNSGENPECTGAGKRECSGACVDLVAMHLRDCGVCALGYADADGDAANGCEARVKLHDGRCVDATDCETLAHVATASCVAGKCQIDACAEGYADCDGNPKTGCEMNGSSNFYRCGARGTCTDATESANYKGKACNLGEECRDGACKPVPEIVGCSDGTREGFLDLLKFNNLAACSGAWTVKGIHHNEGPSCNRKSGNTGENQAGAGCNVEDLCATGWHVCLGRGDVATRSEYGCNGILDGMPQNEPYLFITRTSSTGELNCDPDTVGVPLNMNDIFGCGNFGCYATGNKCDPLKLSGHNLCQALREKCGCSLQANGTVACSNTSGHCNGNGIGHPIDYFGALNHRIYTPAWDCGNDNSGWYEARDIVKTSNDQGGVMCCKNQCEIDADCGAGRICRYNVCVECIINELGQTEGCPAGKTCSASHTCV